MEKKVDKQYLDLFISQYSSRATQKSYYRIVSQMLETIGKPVDTIQKIDITRYRQQWEHLSDNTQALNVSALKSYFQFLKDNDIIETDFSSVLQRPKKIEMKIKDALSKGDALKMIQMTDNTRNKAIIGMYLSTGIRVQELINLKYEDYILNPNEMFILTKGDKYRRIILNNDVQELINDYLKERKTGIDNLFVNNQGHPMRAQDISNMLKRLAKKIGFEGDISNHTLRSTFITDLTMRYGIYVAQQIVGHSNVETTKRYVRGMEEEVADIMKHITL